MDNSNLILIPTFNLRVNPAILTLQDNSNFNAIVSGYSTVKGILQVIAPNGVTIYNNTDYNSPDITQSSLSKTGIILPKDNKGKVIQGNYKVFYQVMVDGVYAERNFTFNYQYVQVVPDLQVTIDGYDSVFTSTDNTNYSAYTIVSLSRTHTVIPPSGSPLSTKTGDQTTWVYNPDIWSGIWTCEIVSNVVYSINSILIEDTITTSVYPKVYKIDFDVLTTYISNFFETLVEATGAKQVADLSRTQLLICGYVDLYFSSVDYKHYLKAYNYAYQIMTLLNPTIISSEEITPFVPPTGTISTDSEWNRLSSVLSPINLTDKIAVNAIAMVGSEVANFNGAIRATSINLGNGLGGYQIGVTGDDLWFQDITNGRKTLSELLSQELLWANIQNKPDSTVENIDAAVEASHPALSKASGSILSLDYTNQVIDIPTANTNQPGAISRDDWNTFNRKQSPSDILTALSNLTLVSGNIILATGDKTFTVIAPGATGQSFIWGATSPGWSNSSGSVFGSNTQVAFNDDGTESGSSDFTFTKGTRTVYGRYLTTKNLNLGTNVNVYADENDLTFVDVTNGVITLASLLEPLWANIQNKPDSTVEQIDASVTKSHDQNTDTGTNNNNFTIGLGNSTGRLQINLGSAGTDNLIILQAPQTTQDITLTLPNKTGILATLSDVVLKALSSTDGYIPKWDGVSGDKIVDGYGVITNLTSPDNYTFATTLAITTWVQNWVNSANRYVGTIVAATTPSGSYTFSTSFANGQVLDGITLSTGQNICIKDYTGGSAYLNGVYTVPASGSPNRITAMNTGAQFKNFTVFIVGGTFNAGSSWTETATVVNVGTDPVYFAQISTSGTYTAGTGISLTGFSFSIDSTVVTKTGIQTLTNKTLTTPVITDFSNATHNHSNSANGGLIPFSSINATPTTLAGYGITDAEPKPKTDTFLSTDFVGSVLTINHGTGSLFPTVTIWDSDEKRVDGQYYDESIVDLDNVALTFSLPAFNGKYKVLP